MSGVRKPYQGPTLRSIPATDPRVQTVLDELGAFVCAQCAKPVDMRAPGASRIGAHGRDFCSMACTDAWEAVPENAEALRASHEHARALGWPYDPSKIGGRT